MSEHARWLVFVLLMGLVVGSLWRIATALERPRYSAPYYVCQNGLIVEASDPRNVGERCDI